MPARTSGLSAVCIIGLVLASLGTLSWCFESAALSMQSLGMGGAGFGGAPPPGATEEYRQALLEIERLQRDWLVINAVLWVWHVLTIGLLFTGCLLGLRMSPRAIRWLKIALFNGIAFHVVGLIAQIVVQLELIPITERMMGGMGGPGGRPPAGFMQIFGGIAIALAVVRTLAILVYYIWGVWYVSQQWLADWLRGMAGDEALPIDDWVDTP